MTRAATFKRTDVARMIRAVLDTGLGVARIEKDERGRITVVPGNPSDPPETNPFEVEAERLRRQAS
jgi:hypothetical protein